MRVNTVNRIMFSLGVALLGLAVGSSAAVGQVGLNVAIGQAGTPVQIVSSTANQQWLFSSVVLKNTSAKAVRWVELGFDVYNAKLSNGAPRLVQPVTVSIELQPGQSDRAVIGRLLAAEVPLGLTGRTAVVLGVLAVGYQDGSRWAYDYDLYKSFTPGASPLATTASWDTGCQPTGQALAADAEAGASPDTIHYQRQGSPFLDYCSNSDTSCTDSGCSDSSHCAKQSCQEIPPSAPGGSL